MRYKKIVLSIIASVLCLGLLNGCSCYSHDFNSSEEAQKYILSKLKGKYNEEFIITEVKEYKEEKIGLNWIRANVSSKENSSQIATVYARNTGFFEDSYHVYYYSDEIEELATPLFTINSLINYASIKYVYASTLSCKKKQNNILKQVQKIYVFVLNNAEGIDIEAKANALWGLGDLERYMGNLCKALELLREALVTLRKIGNSYAINQLESTLKDIEKEIKTTN